MKDGGFEGEEKIEYYKLPKRFKLLVTHSTAGTRLVTSDMSIFTFLRQHFFVFLLFVCVKSEAYIPIADSLFYRQFNFVEGGRTGATENLTRVKILKTPGHS